MCRSTSMNIEQIDLFYGKKQALFDVSMPIYSHAITAFIGLSGCGKSTLLRSLNRMNDYIKDVQITGKITLDGEDIYGKGVNINTLRQKVGMVFQQPVAFDKSIFDNVAYGPRMHGLHDKEKLQSIVEKSLHLASLSDDVANRLDMLGMRLSGGQKQRLAIARALAVEPDVLLLDEPTSALDPILTSRLEDVLLELKKSYTIVIVTHNMEQAKRIADYTAFFWQGHVVEYGQTEQIFSAPKEEQTKKYIIYYRSIWLSYT